MFRIDESFRVLALDAIVINDPLPFDLYVKHSNHLVKFIKSRDILSYEKKEQLVYNKVNCFYIESHHSKVFDTYLASNLGEILNSPHLNKEQKSEIIYTSAIHIMQDMFESKISETKIIAAKDVMAETVKQIVSNQVTASSILKLSSHDYRTYSHCVNVALYSIGMAYEHGLSAEQITEIASGAILHDVGKCEIY